MTAYREDPFQRIVNVGWARPAAYIIFALEGAGFHDPTPDIDTYSICDVDIFSNTIRMLNKNSDTAVNLSSPLKGLTDPAIQPLNFIAGDASSPDETQFTLLSSVRRFYSRFGFWRTLFHNLYNPGVGGAINYGCAAVCFLKITPADLAAISGPSIPVTVSVRAPASYTEFSYSFMFAGRIITARPKIPPVALTYSRFAPAVDTSTDGFVDLVDFRLATDFSGLPATTEITRTFTFNISKTSLGITL